MGHFQDTTNRNDDDTRRRLWASTVPIAFHIDKQDIASMEDPFPLYFTVPRQAYLGFYLDHIARHFRPYVAEFGHSSGKDHRHHHDAAFDQYSGGEDDVGEESAPYEDIWFEYEEMPLKWHLPVGVLFDHLFLEYEKKVASEEAEAEEAQDEGEQTRQKRLGRRKKKESKYLPWKITAHFSSFPSDQLVRLKNENDVKWSCVNVLKEALFSKLGTSRPIMTLSRKNEMKLWNAIKDTNMIEYDTITNLLTEEGDTAVKRFPIRILVNRHAKEQLPPRLICPSRATVESMTLGDFLLDSLPGLFPSKDKLHRANVVIQGVQPSFDTPLRWLAECCYHPDQFLYICVLLP